MKALSLCNLFAERFSHFFSQIREEGKILLSFSHKGGDDTISDLVDKEVREHLQERGLGMSFSGSSRLPRPIWRLKLMAFVW